MRQTTLDAFAHQHLPLEKLLDELNLDRDLSRFPLFQVAFVLLQDPMRQIDVPGYSFSIVKAYEGSYQIPTGATKYDLTLEMTEVEGVLAASIEYSTDLFDKSTILRMLDHYQLVLDQVAAHPKARLSELSLLSESERQQLLQWNATATDYPRQATVQRLFERQVEQLPDAIAVSFGERALSYAELNRRANQLAHYLRSHGVGPDVLVGLCVERSPELIVALLGILKAGGAYAPLDPSYPAERLAWMLEDIRPALLIVDRHLLASLPPFAGTVLCIDQFADLLADQPPAIPSISSAPGTWPM
ncbi:MAG: hypothetical protein KatS3mg057_2226 [Herpetosiphonaceae bacterium]|nr:MAG: hypothetical protein KatS3mg057_2226 [Herpetosiphonaceae bacterium]